MSFACRMNGGTMQGETTGPFLTQFDSYNFRQAVSVQSIVTMTANTDGTLTVVGNGNTNDGDITPNPGWYTPTTGSIGNTYEIRVTATSGTFTSGTVGSWLALSSVRTWTVSSNTLKTVTFTIEIRVASTSEVVATTTGNVITAEYEAP